jgi:Ca2+/Na+ antiporter
MSLSIIWELIENLILIKFGIKFGNRRDSLLNSTMDMVFYFLGSVCALLLSFLNRNYIILFILLFLCTVPVLMVLYAYQIVLKKNKNI